MEIMEDYTALEEEGVTNLKRSKYAIREVCVCNGITLCLYMRSVVSSSPT